MAVGTIASLKVSNLTTTSFDVTFTKPANVTKIRWQMVPTDGSLSIGGKDLTRAVTGTTGSTKVEHFSGLSPNKKYYLYAIPYNGSEQGTTKQYTHSGASPVNSITMGKSIPAPTTPATSTTGYNPLSGIVAQTQSGGKTTNNATSSTGSGAGGNTPQPGTTDPIPNDLNNPSRETIQVEKLETKHTYAIFVRSKATTVDGKDITSPWSLPIHVNTPAYSASGNNFASKNSNGDIQLDGGSLYAGEFPINAGQIDVVNDTPDATGVVLNQTGLAGFNAGAKKFYISASTGDAWFAGTITANAYIAGTLASDLVANAAAVPGLNTTISTISSNYLKVVGDQIQNATGQVSKVSANGTTFYSGTNSESGARILVNSLGILGYDSDSTGPLNNISFAINSTSSTITGTSSNGGSVAIPAGSAYFAGQVTSNSGSIAEWQIDVNQIFKSVQLTDIFGQPTTVTTTLGANGQIQIYSSRSSNAVGDEGLFSILNPNSKTSIASSYISLKTLTNTFGIDPGSFTINLSPGDGSAIIYWDGGVGADGYPIRWVNYQGSGRTLNAAGDVSNRPLVVDTQGYQRLGALNYYGSASSSTMASASFGVDGDLYFSTNSA